MISERESGDEEASSMSASRGAEPFFVGLCLFSGGFTIMLVQNYLVVGRYLLG